MLALNVFSLLVFLALNRLSGTLARLDGKTRTAILRILLSVLLAFNIVKYGLPPLLGEGLRIPVEYSTVAYFVVPLLYLSGLKRGKTWAAYSAIFAGFFYYMTMIVAGGRIYADYPPANVYLSLFCHGTLYLFGLVRLKTETFSISGRPTLFLGVGLVVLNAVVSRRRDSRFPHRCLRGCSGIFQGASYMNRRSIIWR